jgi:hypothetical protein
VATQLHQLTGPVYQHSIDKFNACSRGSTHRSLTDTGRGNNLGGASFPHHTPRSMILHFPPKGAARSQVIQAQHKSLAIKITTPSHRVASMPLDLYRTLQLCLAITNGLQLLKGVVKDNSGRITKMQLQFHTTPIT